MKKTSGKTSMQCIEHLINSRRCQYVILGQCWHLQMFLLIADSDKWSSRAQLYFLVSIKGFCGPAGAQLNCFSTIKTDFLNNKYSLFLGTPTSGHPNLCTSKHYFVTEIEFIRNRPKRADVPIWRKSDLSRIDWSRKLWICAKWVYHFWMLRRNDKLPNI